MTGSRLDSYFEVKDNLQTQRGVSLRDATFTPYQQGSEENLTDSPDFIPTYNENIIQSNNTDIDNLDRDLLLNKLGELGESLSEEDAAKVSQLMQDLFPGTASTEAGGVSGTVPDSGASETELTDEIGSFGNA
jgi:hypothetical protein